MVSVQVFWEPEQGEPQPVNLYPVAEGAAASVTTCAGVVAGMVMAQLAVEPDLQFIDVVPPPRVAVTCPPAPTVVTLSARAGSAGSTRNDAPTLRSEPIVSWQVGDGWPAHAPVQVPHTNPTPGRAVSVTVESTG